MEENADKDLFLELKESILKLDPVYFIEKYLTLDGKPFRLNGNGYKPLADIYRYVALKSLEPDAKPTIIVKSRQTGITTLASAVEQYFMGSGLFGTNGKPPMRVMHAFPQLELAAAYSKVKLNQIIGSSVSTEGSFDKSGKQIPYMQGMLDTSNPANDSLHFKQFKNGNLLFVESLGLLGERSRGKTCDVIFFDEVQATTDAAIGNTLKILTTSKYGNKGVQVFFGTPRGKGSSFHKRWLASTQSFYHLGCISKECNKHFPLYTPESDDWQKTWLYGFIVKCPHCGLEQDKRQSAEIGRWQSFKSEQDEDCKLIGFHINQLYMPMFTKEEILAEMPGNHPVNTERVFQNEVMGEFYQGDSSPMTPDVLAATCADIGRKFSAGLVPNKNEIVVMGVDYGLRNDIEQLSTEKRGQGQSYSTAVILLSKGPGLLSIEFALKFKRNDVESKKGIIEELMRKYGVHLTIGDIGYSNDFSAIMHQAYGDKYLVSRAHNKINNKVKYSADAFPKEIIFERNHFIGELFDQMKKGMIRFPYGDFEKVGWLVDHSCSMEIKPVISRSGADPTINYVKGGTPNDGFMALLNAYLAYKFIITNGFSNNNPNMIQYDNEIRNQPRVHGMYIPSWKI